jgi:hypothetical protein
LKLRSFASDLLPSRGRGRGNVGAETRSNIAWARSVDQQNRKQTPEKFVPSTLQSVHSETYRGSQQGSEQSMQSKTQIQKTKQKNTRSSSISKQNKKKKKNKQRCCRCSGRFAAPEIMQMQNFQNFCSIFSCLDSKLNPNG